eukprot:scaffold9857_cov127-Cylindrotheca_fusiformis.AAC.25
MQATPAEILTAETIPKYLESRLDNLAGVIDSLDGLQVSVISGGNLNYAFCIKPANGSAVFLKQAPEFIAFFGPDGFPLTSKRMQREIDVFEEWRTLLGDQLSKTYLPKIHYFDESHMAVIMEFLNGYELLDYVVVEKPGEYHANVGHSLGDFLGKTHARTHSSKVSQERKEYLTKHFENREMRGIQLEFVFSKCYNEATDEQRAGLKLTPEFMAEIELLKKQYNGETSNLALCHGDIHLGSIMVDSKGNTKVIDPEFTVYGPPGLDLGSLLSGYCLSAIHHAYAKNPEGVERIVEGAIEIWASYSKAMEEEGLREFLPAIEVEAVGFTVAEVCRTVLEFAGGRKWLQFEDAETKAASKLAALKVVENCMIGRHKGGIELLFREMKGASLDKI